MPKIQGKTLTDFDKEIFDDETTQIPFKLTMKKIGKYQFTGSYITNRLK